MLPSQFFISNHLAGKRCRTSSIPPVASMMAARRASMLLFLEPNSAMVSAGSENQVRDSESRLTIRY
jgi:hypothetical protein